MSKKISKSGYKYIVNPLTNRKVSVYSKKAQEIINNCRDNGLLLVTCGENGNVIRFMGPLTTPIKHVEEALGIFENSII